MHNLLRRIRPSYQILQNYMYLQIPDSQRAVLSVSHIQVSFCGNRYFMNVTTSFTKSSSTQSLPALQQEHKHVELARMVQNFSSSSENTAPSAQVKSSNKDNSENTTPLTEVKLSNKDKLKRAVKDYGATVIVFHITISLMSLGTSYLIISSGVDVASLLAKVGLDQNSTLTAGASTFVVAYALHKVFAPVRISITLGATPFIVRYLRRVGVLKPPKT